MALTVVDSNPPAKRQRGLSKKTVVKEAERQLVANSKEVLEKYWKSVKRGLDADAKWAADIVSQAYGYTKSAGGVNILNQVIQQNNASAPTSKKWSFESMVRKAEKKDIEDRETAGPLATEVNDEDIIDVTEDSAAADEEEAE